RVRDTTGLPLPGVRVSILGKPELGFTVSRADGHFDLAVNGGGALTAVFSLDGKFPVHRAGPTPWRDFALLEDVVMTGPDPVVTVISSNAGSMQVARGSVMRDDAGVRQATVLFPAGTTAVMVLPDGGSQPLTSLRVRATEFTVGDLGPNAMPAELPPASAYTYALQLSADEA